MTLPKYPYEREFDRFVEDADGNVAVRTLDGATVDQLKKEMVTIREHIHQTNELLEMVVNHLRQITDLENSKGDKF